MRSYNTSNALLRRTSSGQRVLSPMDQIQSATLLSNPFALIDTVSSPFQLVRRMQEDMDHLFAQVFSDDKEASSLLSSKTPFTPRVDVSETDKEYWIDMELPGIPQEAIDVRLIEGMLTIRAEAGSDGSVQPTQPDNDPRKYHYRERYLGRFERVFHLPPNADEDAVRAELKDGVLSVMVGKKVSSPEERGGRKIAIMPSSEEHSTETKAISGVETQKVEEYAA